MNNKNKKCEECGEPLKPSQYASLKKEGEPAVKMNEDLVCRNYPSCKKAEKEILKSILDKSLKQNKFTTG